MRVWWWLYISVTVVILLSFGGSLTFWPTATFSFFLLLSLFFHRCRLLCQFNETSSMLTFFLVLISLCKKKIKSQQTNHYKSLYLQIDPTDFHLTGRNALSASKTPRAHSLQSLQMFQHKLRTVHCERSQAPPHKVPPLSHCSPKSCQLGRSRSMALYSCGFLSATNSWCHQNWLDL